ncbi:hypothetical protein RHMOL_Rhmol12G0090400 [Rhododendron molle]|uniref:Uncharacterized protein n=1 Tax=Rhododendron molle TaxID=49168 RepID=A0ACC0LGW7_RHOML|nr:hypothetical protein RHMOL_Rhmol12G0090400 [Rhododendron molle]
MGVIMKLHYLMKSWLNQRSRIAFKCCLPDCPNSKMFKFMRHRCLTQVLLLKLCHPKAPKEGNNYSGQLEDPVGKGFTRESLGHDVQLKFLYAMVDDS